MSARAMKATCTACGTVHPSDMARVHGRFTAGPKAYRATHDGARSYGTRAAAELEACQHMQDIGA